MYTYVTQVFDGQVMTCKEVSQHPFSEIAHVAAKSAFSVLDTDASLFSLPKLNPESRSFVPSRRSLYQLISDLFIKWHPKQLEILKKIRGNKRYHNKNPDVPSFGSPSTKTSGEISFGGWQRVTAAKMWRLPSIKTEILVTGHGGIAKSWCFLMPREDWDFVRKAKTSSFDVLGFCFVSSTPFHKMRLQPAVSTL